MQEARKSRYYGDIRYKPGAAATITTTSLTPVSVLEVKAFSQEPADFTVAPATVDTISDSEEEVLQVLEVVNLTKN
jgi:hypothetical protein